MKRYGTQYIEIGHMGLEFQINEHLEHHPQARLVSVILKPRHPGQPEVYSAVWDYGTDAAQQRT